MAFYDQLNVPCWSMCGGRGVMVGGHERIREQCGKGKRASVMDRGVQNKRAQRDRRIDTFTFSNYNRV